MKKSDIKNGEIPQFRTQVNYHLTSHSYETIRGVSETIPDQSYTIREILEKFVVNVPEFLLKNATYNDIEEFPEEQNIHEMDTFEQLQYIKDKTENYNQLLKKQKTEKKQQKMPPETQTKEVSDITPDKDSKKEQNEE